MANIIVNGFNVGPELTQSILSSSLGTFPVQQVGHLKSINTKQENTKVTCTPVIYGGLRFHRNIYHDWSGTLDFTRYNGNLTALIARVMQIFQQGGGETYWTIYNTINNTAAGGQDQYLFTNVVLDDHGMGNFGGDAEVDQSLAFRCQSLTITGSSTIGA